MFGNIILFLKEKWEQFWCIHDYKYRNLLLIVPITIVLNMIKSKRYGNHLYSINNFINMHYMAYTLPFNGSIL